MAQIMAKKRGFSDVLYLDSVSKKNLEEVSSCNIFVAKVLLELFTILPLINSGDVTCVFMCVLSILQLAIYDE